MKELQDVFIPGDTWLYYKIYCGTKTTDTLLTNLIQSLTKHLLDEELIDQWFFIRYNDPQHHIRVRFRSTQKGIAYNLLNYISIKLSPYIQSREIWKVQLDTYQREIARYGEKTMLASETLFFRESNMIVNFISSIQEREDGEQLRWLFSLTALDQLLDDFGLSLKMKLDLLERLKERFGKEFGMNKSLKKQLDKKYRTHKSDIESVLKRQEALPPFPLELLRLKSIETTTAISLIKERTSATRQQELLYSYAHMLMNRIFRSRNRLHEMTMYQLLYRAYKDQYGIENYKK